MARVVVVTSGKGGVGKTTSTAALGAALARTGQNVVVIDFDVGLRNLDLVMGAERRVVFDLINVVQGTAKLSQALIRDKRIETLCLLPPRAESNRVISKCFRARRADRRQQLLAAVPTQRCLRKKIGETPALVVDAAGSRSGT